MARAEAVDTQSQAYVSASRVIGGTRRHVLFRHIVPAGLPTILTVAMLEFSIVMLAESALSFLGIGIQPPATSWGLMVSDGRNYLSNGWWLTALPGLAITTVSVSVNSLSNWIRMISDPHQRSR